MEWDDMIKRVQYFFKENVKVHILCHDGRFYNGEIRDVADPEFLIIVDRYNGETPVFFTEIKRVEKFRED